MHDTLRNMHATMQILHQMHERAAWRLICGRSLVELECSLGLLQKTRVWSFESMMAARVPESQIRDAAKAMLAALELMEQTEVQRAAAPFRRA